MTLNATNLRVLRRTQPQAWHALRLILRAIRERKRRTWPAVKAYRRHWMQNWRKML
jgi:hypothetical protein